VCGHSGGLHGHGGFEIEIGRADVLRAGGLAGEPRVFRGHVIDAFRRDDVDNGIGFAIDDRHGQFRTGDEFLDEEILGMLRCLGNRGLGFGVGFHDLNADRGAFARRLHHEGCGKGRQLGAVCAVDDLGARGGDVGGEESPFREALVEGGAGGGGARAGVGDAFRVEDFLELSVLAEGAVDDVEAEAGAFGEVDVGAGDIDRDGIQAEGEEGVEDSLSRGEGDLPLGAGAAHEDGDFDFGEIHGGGERVQRRGAEVAEGSQSWGCVAPDFRILDLVLSKNSFRRRR